MSDIWNEFERIAVEQGLVTEAQEKSETSPTRRNSLSDDAIRLLYGLEPETIFDKNDKNIIEVAHPETAVVGRAYDAMNAVIENEQQRHDMMTYIALKMPNGHLTQRRYVEAKQELINSLIRAAFTLDHKEEQELMALADSCAVRLDSHSNELVKNAWVQATLIGGAIAGVVGLSYYLIWGADTAQGVYVNSQKVLEAIPAVAGQSYAQGIQENISNLLEKAGEIYALKDELTTVDSIDKAANPANEMKVKAILAKLKEYITQLRKVYQAIPSWVSKIEIAHSTTTQGDSDWWAKLKGLADPIYDDDEEELVGALWGKSNWVASGRTGGLYEAIEMHNY